MYEPPPSTLAASRPREVLVLCLIAGIMFLTGSYVGVDAVRVTQPLDTDFPMYAGYVRTLLCGVIVALIRRSYLSKWDARLLLLAAGGTLVGDYFLILLDRTMPGLVIFIGVHALYSVRHARGLRDALRGPSRGATVRALVLWAVVAYGATAVLLLFVAKILAKSGVLAVDTVYLLVLSTSLWMALATLGRKAVFPTFNARLIACGMAAFYACDVTVGLAAATGGRAALVLDTLVGFFYTPALVLLALSGFRWRDAGWTEAAPPSLLHPGTWSPS